jgi:hypothetical protein
MSILFFLIPSVLIVWGIYCLRKGFLWIRTREPSYREEVGEGWYIGINAFLVFAGLFAMAVLNGISFPPVGSYLHWVFEVCVGFGRSQCREPTFFLRLVPGYLVTVAVLALLRPKRR